MPDSYLFKLKDITTFIFDVDGVMTDGRIILTSAGDQQRTMNIKDGFALQFARKQGYKIAVISGGKAESIRERFIGLGIHDVYLGVADKIEAYKELCDTYNIKNENVLLLNGNFNEKDRQDILTNFKNSKEHNVMIINYKIGSEGLNLMEANNVILCENWWCPSVMEQAKHRAYRIGQKRKVFIYNIITKNTIEEKIKKICDKKEEISKNFMNDVFDCFKKSDYSLNLTTLKKIIF